MCIRDSEDSFFIDVGGIFDLLNLGTPDDQLSDNNVHSIVIQVPIVLLSETGAMPTSASDDSAIIGVRTTSHRQGVRVLRQLGDMGSTLGTNLPGAQDTLPAINRGPWIQLSRLDIPLINELIILIRDKDRFNGSKPKNDGQFLQYVTGGTAAAPAPGSSAAAAPHYGLLLETVLGADVPGPARNDLVQAFLLGVAGVNLRSDVVASSQLRLNMMIKPTGTVADDSRLGVITPMSLGGPDTQGFPNGRRLADDVVDIATLVVAGILVDGVIDPPLANGDGVNTNSRGSTSPAPFADTFPYVLPPLDHEDAEPGG